VPPDCGIESTTLLRGRGHFLTFTDDDLSRQARDKNCNRKQLTKKGLLCFLDTHVQLCQLEELYSEYEFSEVNKTHIYYYY
jgi:hypothetical protein